MAGKINVERVIGNLGWLLVILAGVTISSWSLYSLARVGKIPPVIAGLTGITYDGLAFVSSVQAMAWNRLPNAYGIGSRLAMLSAAGLSAYLNYEHGKLLALPLPVCLMLASAPLAGLWALENHVRYLHKASSQRLPLPKPEAVVWALFPIKAWKLLRAAVESRMEELGAVKIPMARGDVTPEQMREWLRAQGIEVGYSGPISAEHRRMYAKAMSNGGIHL